MSTVFSGLKIAYPHVLLLPLPSELDTVSKSKSGIAVRDHLFLLKEGVFGTCDWAGLGCCGLIDLYVKDNCTLKVLFAFFLFYQEYEKVQSRVNRQSRQRLADGKVRIMIKTEAQIEHIGVCVERIPMAAALSGDVTGRVPLNVKLGAQMINKVRKRLVIGKRKIRKFIMIIIMGEGG